jgi:hypothetical protein
MAGRMVTPMSLRFGIVLTSAAAAVASVVACGSGSDGSNLGGSPSGYGSTNGYGSTSGAGDNTGVIFGMGGTSGGYIDRDSGTGAGAPTSVDAACGAAILSPEAIKVDKTIEQKIDCTAEVPEPIAIYLMLDNSLSMKDNDKWKNAVAAINSFVKTDPALGAKWTCVGEDGKSVAPPANLAAPGAGAISVAIQYFHPKNAGSNPNECDGNAHATPAVSMAALPGNGANITASLAGTAPESNTPTVGSLIGGTKYCQNYEAANPGKKCALVLVTDGQPNGCGLSAKCADGSLDCVDAKSATTLTPTAKRAHDDAAHSVVTFTVGMSGVTKEGFALLDAIAIAGGSDCTPNTPGNETCNVTTSGADGLLEALKTIRKSVQVTSTANQSVTTTSTVSTTLACEWAIPKPTGNQIFDKDLVNISYSGTGGSERLGNVPTKTDCAAATGGWYYDDPNTPKRILACPQTCNVIQNMENVKLQVLIGCSTVPAIVR